MSPAILENEVQLVDAGETVVTVKNSAVAAALGGPTPAIPESAFRAERLLARHTVESRRELDPQAIKSMIEAILR